MDLPEIIKKHPRRLAHAIIEYESAARKIDERSFAVAVAGFIKWGRSFNITIPDVANLTALYYEVLGDLPAQLVAKAFERARKEWRWGNRMPLPADLLDFIAADRDEFGALGRTLKAAQMRLERERRDAERKAEIDRAWWEDHARRSGITVEEAKNRARVAASQPRKKLAAGGASEHTISVRNALENLAKDLPNPAQDASA